MPPSRAAIEADAKVMSARRCAKGGGRNQQRQAQPAAERSAQGKPRQAPQGQPRQPGQAQPRAAGNGGRPQQGQPRSRSRASGGQRNVLSSTQRSKVAMSLHRVRQTSSPANQPPGQSASWPFAAGAAASSCCSHPRAAQVALEYCDAAVTGAHALFFSCNLPHHGATGRRQILMLLFLCPIFAGTCFAKAAVTGLR